MPEATAYGTLPQRGPLGRVNVVSGRGQDCESYREFAQVVSKV